VQVYLVNSNIGSLTGARGQFLIVNAPAGTHELRADRLGMGTVSQQVTVAAGQVIEVNFIMSTQALGLDEIVVTGAAGSARRREIGNSIAQIRTDELPIRANKVQQMLMAAAPGVNMTSKGGEFGQSSAIRLRGNSSMTMSNSPLIYIDGIQVRSQPPPRISATDHVQRSSNIQVDPLADLNPNDIERIEIIKGSAATTLYGTEAAGGVIQIFTKSGSAGAPIWTLESQQSAAWMRNFGTAEFPKMRYDGIVKTGHSQDYRASVRGGGQALQYFISGAYADHEGVLPNEYGTKWIVRGNFTVTPMPDLQVQWNTSYTRDWMQNVSQNNSQGITHNVSRENANYIQSGDPQKILEAVLPWDLQNWIDRLTTGGVITYSPLPNFTNRFTVGWDMFHQNHRNLRPYGYWGKPTGALLDSNFYNTLLTFDYVSTYSFNLLNVRSSFSWGGQAIGDEERQLEGWGENFPGAVYPTVSSASFTTASESRRKTWTAGFFFQNVFDVKNRYFVTLGARVDGSSTFGSGFGLQVYPKVSGSWVISDEAFWQSGWGEVKLRSAYGVSGRAPSTFDAVRTWTTTGLAGLPAFVPQNLGNPDLGPEVTAEFETGFDGSWLDGRLRADLTYYRQVTSEALFNVAQVPSEGDWSGQRSNVGKFRNSGVELALNASPILTPKWGFDLGLNVTTNSSEILDLGGAAPFSTGGGWIEVGQPAPVLRGRYVTNPDEIGVPIIDINHNYGPTEPTLMLVPSISLRVPGGISLSARGEWKSGHYSNESTWSSAVGFGARTPYCWQYYVDPVAEPINTTLKPDTPALWRARCDARYVNNTLYTQPRDYFRLRSASAIVPMDFAFPDRVRNPTLTVSLLDSYTYYGAGFGDPELGSGGGDSLVRNQGFFIPSPVRFQASLQIQF